MQRRGRRDGAAHRFRVGQVGLGAARGRDIPARCQEALDHRDSQATPAARDECIPRHPPEPGLAFLTVLVNQLTDGQDIDIVLLVRDRKLRTKRDGGEYLKLGLADRTGSCRR